MRDRADLVIARCPDAKLDGGTRAFVEGGGSAVQLASAELLAQHDARLA